jgi:ribosomal protein S18 acetylase RimI-like enzyme
VLLYSDPAGDAFVAIGQDAPVPNAATIEFVAVQPERRRLGVGGRAVLATEQALSGLATCLYVAVRAEIGIALYFWLRLGYRPLLQGDWPNKPSRDSVWMRRDRG